MTDVCRIGPSLVLNTHAYTLLTIYFSTQLNSIPKQILNLDLTQHNPAPAESTQPINNCATQGLFMLLNPLRLVQFQSVIDFVLIA